MKDIIKALLDNDILTVYSDGVYIMGDNKDYSLMIYDAKQRIDGKVVEIWDNLKNTTIIGADGDILVFNNQYNILTMIDHKNNSVIDSSKIVYHFAQY